MLALSRWKRAFRFSLGGLLFVMLGVCAYFGSYRSGRLAGEQDRYDESYFVKSYGLADLVVDQSAAEGKYTVLEEAQEFVASHVTPESWDVPGDEVCQILVMPSIGALVVSQRGAAHDQVEACLEEFRRQHTASKVARWIEAIDELVAAGESKPRVLYKPPPLATLAMPATDLRYEALITEVTRRWGKSQFAGKCTEPGFPNWSVAQSLATWSAEGGVAYVAVQDRPKTGRCVIAGWRPLD